MFFVIVPEQVVGEFANTRCRHLSRSHVCCTGLVLSLSLLRSAHGPERTRKVIFAFVPVHAFYAINFVVVLCSYASPLNFSLSSKSTVALNGLLKTKCFLVNKIGLFDAKVK